MANDDKQLKIVAPSNFQMIKDLRLRKDLKMLPCPYMKPETSLRYYQTVGSLNMLMSNRMLLGDSPGTGKTIQTISTQAVLKQKDPTMKFLVATIKSSKRQWGKEFAKFSQGMTYHVLQDDYKPIGGKAKLTGFKAREAQYKDFKDVDVLITGYHPIKEDYKLLVECRGPNFMVVFDECQEFKNEKTKAYLGACHLSERAVRVVGLSATPIKNRLLEFYHILAVLVPGVFPGITRFKQIFCKEQLVAIPAKGGKRYVKQVVGYKNLDMFRASIEPYFLARATQDVSDELPKLIARRVEVELSDVQRKLYAEALSGVIYQKRVKQKLYDYMEVLKAAGTPPTLAQRETLIALKEKYDESMMDDAMAKNKGAALTFCQQIANGPGWIGEEGSSPKEDEFRRLVADELASEKIIVFTRFESGIERLSNILKEEGIKFARVSGKENGKQREDAMMAFQDMEGDTRVIFITNAGSAAINLQAASVEIFYDTPWSFGDLCQTIGRAQRIGSVHANVLVIHLVTEGTIDAHVLDVLGEKKWLTDQIMGDIALGALEFGPTEVTFVEEQGDTDALFNKVFR